MWSPKHVIVICRNPNLGLMTKASPQQGLAKVWAKSEARESKCSFCKVNFLGMFPRWGKFMHYVVFPWAKLIYGHDLNLYSPYMQLK
jgi:hypothetical protein